MFGKVLYIYCCYISSIFKILFPFRFKIHLFHFKGVKKRKHIFQTYQITTMMFFYSFFYLRYYNGFGYVLFHNLTF